MPNATPQNRKAFEENIDILFEELELATKWGRPSILVAIHKSKFGQDKAEKALEDKLSKLGQKITRIVTSNEHPDVPHLILGTAPTDKSVFFVSNIDWGGGIDGKDAYRALNMYRELLVENQIKAVFWLTANEATNLPRYAPDFWAFRHRVIEFASQHSPKNINLPAGVLIWHAQDSIDSFDKPEQRILAREELLAKLPHNIESLSSRIELLYSLGHLYWVIGNSSKASNELSAGLDLAGKHDLPQIKSRLLNGMAIISYEEEDYQKATEIYKEAVENNPGDSILLINQSAVCCALGRNYEAISISKRAIKMDPANAKIWNSLGYIYSTMGKPGEAISCFAKAAELAPNTAIYHEALAIVYHAMGQTDESKHRLNAARTLAGTKVTVYLHIYEEAILGNKETALKLLRTALETNQISKNDIRRDPNINMLFDPSQVEAVAD